jgi:two-component system, cell cycle response regulator DivK
VCWSLRVAPRVLIVDDTQDNRDLYAEYLRYKGWDVLLAVDGKEGLALVAEQGVHAIVMDLAMPLVDGWEAMRRLKATPATSSIPIIALTGHVGDDAMQRAFDAGCDVYLVRVPER